MKVLLQRSLGAPQAGFSLSELVIVMGIISILSSIGATGYDAYKARVRKTEVTVLMKTLRAMIDANSLEYGTAAGLGQKIENAGLSRSFNFNPATKQWNSPASAAMGLGANFNPEASHVNGRYSIKVAFEGSGYLIAVAHCQDDKTGSRAGIVCHDAGGGMMLCGPGQIPQQPDYVYVSNNGVPVPIHGHNMAQYCP